LLILIVSDMEFLEYSISIILSTRFVATRFRATSFLFPDFRLDNKGLLFESGCFLVII
jgi:hypothetical protein